MPYIKQVDRDRLAKDKLDDIIPKTKGELNYTISVLMHNYILGQGKSYQTLSDAHAAAIDAAAEFNRMVLAPYEDKKRKETGPISVLDSDDDSTSCCGKCNR